MYQPQFQDTEFSSVGSKRPRTGTGPKGEGDWTCPNCGNVNFSFRSTCNMRKCSTPKPDERPPPLQYRPQSFNVVQPMYEQGAPQYIGGHPLPPQIANYAPAGSYSSQVLVSPLAAFPATSAASAGQPFIPQNSFVQLMGIPGPSYLTQAPDQFMNRGPQITSPVSVGGFDPSDGHRKRRGGPEGSSEGDWVCPNCGNRNFGFRSICNMRKCSTPKPTEAGLPSQTRIQDAYGSSAPPAAPPRQTPSSTPEGSWTCPSCANVNYPFRTHCNRRNCGVEKPSAIVEKTEAT